MATTDGSLSTTPRPGTNTSVLAVPRSMPSLGVKKATAPTSYSFPLDIQTKRLQALFYTLVPAVYVVHIFDYRGALGHRRRHQKRQPRADVGALEVARHERRRS